jgi:hypothetical protein
MTLRRYTLLALLLAFAQGVAPASRAQDEDYTAVETKDLVKNPQWFWAKGIVFKDTLVAPPRRGTTRFGDRPYQEVELKVLGPCYVDTALAPAMADAALGKEYTFTGTVYQRGRRYVVAIQRMVAQVRDLEELQDALKAAFADVSPTDPHGQTMHAMNELIGAIQSRLLANAQARDTTLAEVLKPDSPFAESTMREIRNALQALADERKEQPAEFLAQYIAAVLAYQSRPAEAVVIEAPEVEQPEAILPEEPVKPSGGFRWLWGRKDKVSAAPSESDEPDAVMPAEPAPNAVAPPPPPEKKKAKPAPVNVKAPAEESGGLTLQAPAVTARERAPAEEPVQAPKATTNAPPAPKPAPADEAPSKYDQPVPR